jgi:diguanylate cyclase (GGDEF)-like protein
MASTPHEPPRGGPAAAGTPRRWPARRLSTRIVFTFLGLLLVVQGLGFVGLQSTLEARERSALESDLKVGAQALRSLLERHAERLAAGARLAARDHGFNSTVGSDAATIASVLENYIDRLCETSLGTAAARAERDRCSAGTVAALFDTQFRLQGNTRPDLPDLAPLARALALPQYQCRRPGDAAAPEGIANGSVLMVGKELMQFVAAPRCSPDVSGWVLMGFAIDQQLAQDLHAISGLHLLVMKRAHAGLPWQTSIGTLPPATTQALQAAVGTALPQGRLYAGNEEFRALAVPLGSHSDGAAVGVLLRSVDEALAAFHELQRGLALLTLGGMLLFAAGSVVTARHITTPLRALARASERLGQGSLDEPVPQPAQHDEVGELAAAVEQMRLNIRDKQGEIRRLAYYDRLTELPNRASFREAVAEGIDCVDAEGGHFALVMLGLDRFKVINENLGYTFGDRVLRAVAERLRGAVQRHNTLLARLPGDQFAVLLRDSDAAKARHLVDDITVAFLHPLVFPDQTVDIAATFGLACWPTHAPEQLADPSSAARAEMLLARAEVAMYSAKQLATALVTYDPAIDAGSAQTLTLLSELRQAIAQQELRLFLQPKLDLASRRITGAEALVRWQHPTRGMVPPLQFIPFAEDTGFVRQLTLWIFEETARQWPALSALGLQRVSVNLSTRDLIDPDLPQRFDAILKRQGVPATAFCLEITESAIMQEPKRALAMLEQLSAAGFKLSIDDYGEGQTTLSYLKRLPVHELKIDQIFIKKIEQDAVDAKIVHSTIGLAHSLGFSVVAEGVESAAALELLGTMGCDEAQGFHMSRPLPAAELPAFVARWLVQQGLEPASAGAQDGALTATPAAAQA